MSNGKSHQELVAQGLSPQSINLFGEAEWFVDTSHHLWNGCGQKMMLTVAQMVVDGHDISDIPLWRRRKDLEEDGTLLYNHISDFKHRKEVRKNVSGPVNVIRFDPMLKVEKYAVAAVTRQKYRDNNVDIFRFYMMGKVDTPVRCPIEGILIDAQEFWGQHINNCWQQHHFVFLDGKSLQKDGQDPGKNNCTTDLMSPSANSRRVLEDTMRTIFVSATAHDKIHKHSTSGDITSYPNHQLPWALQNAKNWNVFTRYLVGLGYESFPSYEVWYNSLKLESNLAPELMLTKGLVLN